MSHSVTLLIGQPVKRNILRLASDQSLHCRNLRKRNLHITRRKFCSFGPPRSINTQKMNLASFQPVYNFYPISQFLSYKHYTIYAIYDAIYWYSNMASSFQDKIAIFKVSFLCLNPQKRFGHKENKIKYRSFSWKRRDHERLPFEWTFR